MQQVEILLRYFQAAFAALLITISSVTMDSIEITERCTARFAFWNLSDPLNLNDGIHLTVETELVELLWMLEPNVHQQLEAIPKLLGSTAVIAFYLAVIRSLMANQSLATNHLFVADVANVIQKIPKL